MSAIMAWPGLWSGCPEPPLSGGGVDARSKSSGRSTGAARAQSIPSFGGPVGVRIEPDDGEADGRGAEVVAGAVWEPQASVNQAATMRVAMIRRAPVGVRVATCRWDRS